METSVWLFIVFLVGIPDVSHGLTGNVCKKSVETFIIERYCAYNTWIGCCVFKYRRVCVFVTKQYCCDGWKEDNGNCNIAICSDGCYNGKCTTPNNCVCDTGYKGKTCGEIKCSHLKPCYPGSCTGADFCTCSTNFTAQYCLSMQSPPEFTLARAKIAHFKAMKNMDIYNLTTDSTETDSNAPDSIWTNMQVFNHIKLDLQAIFKQGVLPLLPSYVTAAKFGTVEATITYKQTNKQGSVKGTQTKTCDKTMSSTNPTQGIFNCTITDEEYNLRIDTGDTFTITYSVKSGGFEELNVDGKKYKTELFKGQTQTKSLQFKFDHDVPQHCSELNKCGVGTKYPMKILNDVTKDPLQIVWSGWTDADSKMHRYALEIFKLTKQGDLLLESNPLGPLNLTEFNETGVDPSFSYIYKPTEPGMYSVILEASDNANNSRYIRRFALYDPSSSITFLSGSSSKLKVASASQNSNYTWQANQAKSATQVIVNWENHFLNNLHVNGGFLNKILDYPAQLLDIEVSSEHKKKIDTRLTDNTVKRSSSAIANRNGIVRFEVNKATKIFGQVPETPSSGWTAVNPLAEEYKLSHTANDGDCLMIWVRAFDFINNNNTDATLVCFDSSQPIIRSSKLTDKNIQTTNFNAASRIAFTVLDPESGINRIEWKTVDNFTNKVIKEGTPVLGNVTAKTKAQCDLDGDCYCVTSGECYLLDYTMELDHCALYQEGINLATSVVRFEMKVFNQAMLTNSISFEISDINSFDGMSYCESVLRVFVAGQTSGLTGGGIAGISVALILAIAFLLFVIFLWRTGRLKTIKEQSVEKIQTMRSSVRRGNIGAVGYKQYQTGGFDQEDIYLYGTQTYETTPDWLLKPEDLVLGAILKTGKFARIYHAVLYVGGKPTNVVAKTLKENFTEEDSILMNAKINFFGTKVGRHPCVLNFVGGITGDPTMGPVMLLECCDNGPMKDWLTAQKSKVNDSMIENLYRFSYDIVQGMEHLASKQIVHMRLAARNIFLTTHLEAKVAGFGPRHGDDEEDGGKKERIPVKWIAPECFDNPKAASEKSDVWSFGVVLWEIFTFGDNPYPNIRSHDLPKHLRKGERLEKPEYSDDTHYAIMKKCWQKSPKDRPTFTNMRKSIEQMFQQNSAGDTYYYDSNK